MPYINLMTENCAHRAVVRRHSRLWAYTIPLTLLLLGSVAARQYTVTRPIARQRAQLEKQYHPTRTAKQATTRLTHQIKTLLREQPLVVKLSKQRPLSVLLGTVSQAATQPGMQLRIEEIHVDEVPPQEQSDGSNRGRMRIGGVAVEADDVSALVSALSVAPFENVQLESKQRMILHGHELTTFSILLEY